MSNCGSSTPQPVEQGLFDRPCRTAAVRSPFRSRSGPSISALSNYSHSTWTQIRDFPQLATTFAIFYKNNINSQKNSLKLYKVSSILTCIYVGNGESARDKHMLYIVMNLYEYVSLYIVMNSYEYVSLYSDTCSQLSI